MLLHTREPSARALDRRRDTTEIARTSRLVSRLTGYQVQPNKAIVGPQRLRARGRHPPGRRAEGAHDLRDHGRDDDRARDATRSCSASTPAATRCATRWRRWASRSTAQALNTAFKRFKEIADRKKQVTAIDLEAIVTDELREEAGRLRARVVRGRGLVAAPAAREGRGHAARAARSRDGQLHRRRPDRRVLQAINAATGVAARAQASSRRRGHRGPATRSARSRWCSSSTASRRRPGRVDGHHRGVRRAYVRALSNALADSPVAEAEHHLEEAARTPDP